MDDKNLSEHVEAIPNAEREDDTAPPKDLSAMYAVNDAEREMTYWQGIKRYRIALLYCLFVSQGSMLNGLDGSLQGSIISVPAFRQAFGTLVNGEYIVPAGWQSAWNGGQRFASRFIALGAGSLGDLIGRRNTLFIACVTCIVSVFMMVFVKDHNYIQQLFARMINGGSCAIFSAVAGVYACELSPLPVRGLTTAGHGLNIWIVIGQL